MKIYWETHMLQRTNRVRDKKVSTPYLSEVPRDGLPPNAYSVRFTSGHEPISGSVRNQYWVEYNISQITYRCGLILKNIIRKNLI